MVASRAANSAPGMVPSLARKWRVARVRLLVQTPAQTPGRPPVLVPASSIPARNARASAMSAATAMSSARLSGSMLVAAPSMRKSANALKRTGVTSRGSRRPPALARQSGLMGRVPTGPVLIGRVPTSLVPIGPMPTGLVPMDLVQISPVPIGSGARNARTPRSGEPRSVARISAISASVAKKSRSSGRRTRSALVPRAR